MVDAEISWIAPIIIGAIVPFLVMVVGKVGTASKTAASNLIHIDEMKTDINDIRAKMENAIDKGNSRITDIIRTLDDIKADVKLHSYKLERLESRNGIPKDR